jgi:predicted O-linked N-acetylglucosamine transferase (SPINDLY family)
MSLDNQDQNKSPSPEEIQKQIDDAVAERLAKLKSNLDSAYSSRDEAVKKLAQLEAEAKDRELKQLEAEGKHKEVAEMKLVALQEQLSISQKKITELTRDAAVRDSLVGLDFRNDRSQQMAYRDVLDQLVQDSNGNWVHKTGVSIKDFVSSFSKDEENSFLFKPKQSSGGGSQDHRQSDGKPLQKKITEMTSQELIAAAQAGQLGQFSM